LFNIPKDTFEEKYAITQEDEIVLYGYNAYCREQVEQLIEKGYTVTGILDQNPENRGKYKDIPIECGIEKLTISRRTCVFIMLQNGMLHWDIACRLYKHGISRIVFLPMKKGFYSNRVQADLIVQYNYMMEGKYPIMRVPCLKDEMLKLSGERKWYIEKRLDSEEYIIWVAKDLIRTTLKEPEKYRDIPIADFTPYINLFSCLSGNKTDISEYIKLFGKAPFPDGSVEAYKYVIAKRRGLYEFFEDKFNSGCIDYFAAAAPKAVWNESGYLNLCEGQHRCIYLLLRGLSYVPVRVNLGATDKLLGEEVYE